MPALASLTARSDASIGDDPRTERARRMMCAVALAVAPVLLTIGALLSVSTGDKAAQELADIAADRNRFFAANLLLALGGAALVPGAIALAHLVRARGAAWMTTGACMVALGGGSLAVAIWSYNSVGFVATDSKVNRDGVVSLIDRANDSIVVGLPWLLATGALIGMIVAAVGLIRSRAVPLWQPILLIVAPFLIFFGGDGVLSAVLSLPLDVALIALAYEALRRDRIRAATPTVGTADREPAIDLTDGGDMPTPRASAEGSDRRPQASR